MKTETLHFLFGPDIETGIILSAVFAILLVALCYGIITQPKRPKRSDTTDFYRHHRDML